MEKNIRSQNSKKIALAGILTALGVVALFLENILPTGKLGFYVFSGFLLSVVIMECGLLYGWVSYGAVSLMAFLLVPEKTAVIPYVVLFGVYSLIKNYIERLNKIIIEWVLKFIFYNISLYILWNIALLFIPLNFMDSVPVYMVVILLQGVFFLYDWLFTLWTHFYIEKLQPKIQRR